ncbi:unnamed protein product [Calypogeia fissa]
MPPSAVVIEGVGGGVDSERYSNAVEGEAAVQLMNGLQFKMDDFRPVKALGSGDMGNVYLVAQRSNNAPYAMKVMRKDVLRARKNEHRAQSERDILASINHPFLPVLHSHFEDEKHMFFVMNYCHAGDLNILRHKQPEKRFSENACRFYVAEVLLALEYLHKRNIVYRDLKPENILIRADGHIMLTDFDLSLDLTRRKWTKPASVVSMHISPPREKKSSKASQMKVFFACGSPGTIAKKKSPTARVTPEGMYSSRGRGSRKGQAVDGPTNSFVGTEEYVAPEIVWGKGHGLPVDWWTLGIFLFELFYGKTPFKGLNRKETFYSILCKPVTFPGVPNHLTDLISKLLAKEPENRLGTNGGAEEIKKHPFFHGVNWDELEYMSRTPVVPEPFSWEQVVADMAEKAKASSGKEVRKNWSFCESAEPPIEERTADENGTNTARFSGPLSLKSNVSSSVSPPEDYTADEACSSSEYTSSSESHPDIHKQLASFSLKEEVRLAPVAVDDVMVEQRLFRDVF